MKKSFSLLEIIVVVIIISILASFVIEKSNDSLEFANKTKMKSEIAMIRNSITKQNTSQILLNNENILSLDEAFINEEKSELFKNILDSPLISTSLEKKELGKWIKFSINEYKIYLSENDSLEFKFENNSFRCISIEKLCKEFE